MDWVYLDNNATTRPAAEVAAAVAEVNQTLWANPSSVHRFGQMVRQRIELARASVAALIGCRERELLFTSGGTESNNLALRGILAPAVGGGAAEAAGDRVGGGASCSAADPTAADRRKPLLITSRVEHSAIREPAEALAEAGVEVLYVPVDREGRVLVEALAAALSQHATAGRTALLSLQWANNETGVIQPIAAIAAAVQARRLAERTCKLLLHIDGTQAVGKLPVDVKRAGIDLMTLAAHKFHGPKAAGALYVRTGVRPRPQNLGGPQERDRRGGTENTAGIIGMGVAAELAREFLAEPSRAAALAALRDQFEREVSAALAGTLANGGVVVNSARAARLWNTSNLGFPRLEAEAILLGLSERGLCASAGAACSSGSLEPSPVLLAMGVPEEVAHGSVRFSLSRETTVEEIERAVEIVSAVVRRLARTLPAEASH